MRFVRSAAFLAAVALPASLLAQKQSVTAPGMNATATLTPGIRDGNILYVSGQLGTSRDAPDSTIQGQTKRALENVQKIVEAAGSTMANVLKCTVFLADMQEWAAMNEVYTEFVTEPFPSRTTVGVALPFGMLVEIDALAVVED